MSIAIIDSCNIGKRSSHSRCFTLPSRWELWRYRYVSQVWVLRERTVLHSTSFCQTELKNGKREKRKQNNSDFGPVLVNQPSNKKSRIFNSQTKEWAKNPGKKKIKERSAEKFCVPFWSFEYAPLMNHEPYSTYRVELERSEWWRHGMLSRGSSSLLTIRTSEESAALSSSTLLSQHRCS